MTEQSRLPVPLHEQPEVHARRWAVLAVMCLSLVLVVMAVSALNVAIPSMATDLGLSGTELLWVVDAYAIVFAGLLLIAGAMGDRFGRRGALEGGLVVFAIGAVVAAVASEAGQVILGRAIMGGGAAFIMPATLSIITAVFPPEERLKAIAIWAGFAGAGGAIGPIVSGLLLTGFGPIPQFDWPAAFLFNVPIIIGVLLVVHFRTPKSREAVPTPLDPVAGVLSIVGITALLFSIIQGPELGWTSATVLGSFVLAVVVGVLFVWWELRREHPMLPISFFRSRLFSVGAGVITFMFMVAFGFFLLQTLYVQFVLGYTALEAGLATLPLAVAIVATAPRSASLAARFGSGPVMGIGFVILAVGLALLTQVTTTTEYWYLALSFVPIGVGLALTSAPATGNILTSVPVDKAGVGSAMNDTTRELGGALGIALGGSVVASIFASTIDLSGFGLSEDLLDIASDSIGGAFGIATVVGGEAGALIIAAGQQAFTGAFSVTMGLAAIVAFIGGFVTWRAMRGHEAPAMVAAGADGSPDVSAVEEPAAPA